jgi:hypothetical protein
MDPVAQMLSSTFKSHDLPGALDNALRESLLGSKRKVTMDVGALMGLNKVLGESVHTRKVRPRGPGSGAVFDAGAQWVSAQNMRRYKQLQKALKANKLSVVPETDPYTTVEGLRIPDNLDTVGTVSFVLTQETGKLKPKDLKAAIERNRAEKKERAEEQAKIREQGGEICDTILYYTTLYYNILYRTTCQSFYTILTLPSTLYLPSIHPIL